MQLHQDRNNFVQHTLYEVIRILKDAGLSKEGLNIISCPTCGRIEADLVSAVAQVEEKTKHIKTPLNVSVMGCVVNALGEAKSADVAIAYGKGTGLIIKKGETIRNNFVQHTLYEVIRLLLPTPRQARC